jgi:thiamine biosynthesis lipoprotein
MNRRDFLDPRRLAQTAGHVLGALDEVGALPPEKAEAEDVALLRFGRRAMATTFEVILPYGTPFAIEAAEAALDEIDRLEAQLTVYRDTSEVSALNRHAATSNMPVEPRLFELLTLAARLSDETDGAFDISVGALIKAWGFYRRRGRVPSGLERAEVRERIGMQHVRLDPEGRTVHYDAPGLEINLGSIGKGYALDRAAELLRRRWSVRSGLLHGGHSSILALGSEPGRSDGWAVGVRHPWAQEERLGMLRVRDRALATSAATFQHLEYNGRKLGHILDPRTCWPAEGLASATVLAPSAAEADALATAFFILGVGGARAYCERRPGIGAVLLPAGEGARAVVLNLAPAEIQLAPSSPLAPRGRGVGGEGA